MAEYIRDITITIVVDTNKRTERQVVRNMTLDGAKDHTSAVLDEIKESTDG
jgi:hypothetical protein